MTLPPPEPARPARSLYPAYPGELLDPAPPPGPHPAQPHPAHFAPMGLPPGWVRPAPLLQPLRSSARVASVFGVLFVVLQVAEAAGAWWSQQAYIDEVNSGGTTWDMVAAYDIVTYFWFPVAVGAYVSAGVWLQRAHTQARVLRPSVPQRRSSGWVWGGWITPVVNLWFPLQVVADAWPVGTRRDGRALRGWWWAAWLTSFGTSLATSGLLVDDTSVLRWLGPGESVDAAASAVALALWLKIVWTITRNHDRAIGAVGTPTNPGGHPAQL